MAVSAASVIRGPGEIAAMVVDVTRRIFTTRFQLREFIEQAWFITSVTLMPTILVSIPFGAVISLQVGNLTGQLGAQSFAGATAVLAVVREAAPIAAALIIAGAAGSAICSDLGARKIREEIDAIDVKRGVVAVDRPTDADVLEHQQEVLRVEQERLEGCLGLIEAYQCACRDLDDLEKRASRLYADANFHRDRGERNLAAIAQKDADALAAERATLQTIRAKAYEALFKAGIL